MISMLTYCYYRCLLNIVFQPWSAYCSILTVPTAFAYKHSRHTCARYVGVVLLTPLYLVWAFWSVAIPTYLYPNLYTLIGVVPTCLFLAYQEYRIVYKYWQDV